jgi:hypothetical protein
LARFSAARRSLLGAGAGLAEVDDLGGHVMFLETSY